MEQIRDILKQLALHLELNIAMCDVLDDHSKRIEELERHQTASKTRIDTLFTQVSTLAKNMSDKAYEARKASMDVQGK